MKTQLTALALTVSMVVQPSFAKEDLKVTPDEPQKWTTLQKVGLVAGGAALGGLEAYGGYRADQWYYSVPEAEALKTGEAEKVLKAVSGPVSHALSDFPDSVAVL